MKEELAEEKLIVQSYGDDGFRVAGKRIDGAILIGAYFADKINITSLNQLDIKSLEEMIAACSSDTYKIEIVLFGGGDNMCQIPPECTTWLASKNIAFDIMNTGAAARTYNVLQSENRKVVAVMLPVS
jgi:uncharacterized protein